jgi:hypothetical protein
MSTNAGAYDTSRLYRSGSHTMNDEEPARRAIPAGELTRVGQGSEDRAAFVEASLRPAAAAAVAYSEYLMAAADLPRDQWAVLDALRRQAHRILWSLSALAAADAHSGATSSSAPPSGDRAVA